MQYKSYISNPIKSKEIWVKNPMERIDEKTSFDLDERIIVQRLPQGKMLEIVWVPSRANFTFSSDGLREGDPLSVVGNYLNKYIYPKLILIVNEFFKQEVHFYGYISKTGMLFTDIYVNSNWIDWDLASKFYKDSKLKIPETFFVGALKDFHYEENEGFILRSEYEFPDKRLIMYYKNI